MNKYAAVAVLSLWSLTGCRWLADNGECIGRTLQDDVAPAVKTVVPTPIGDIISWAIYAAGGAITLYGAHHGTKNMSFRKKKE